MWVPAPWFSSKNRSQQSRLLIRISSINPTRTPTKAGKNQSLPSSMKTSNVFCLILLCFVTLLSSSSAFQSDELLLDDEEFGIEGGRSPPDLDLTLPTRSTTPPPITTQPLRRKSSDSDSDSRVQFSLEHAFGDSDFSSAGNFTARLKTWSHGGQTLTKLRFSREALSETDKEKFKKLLEDDDFYRIRVPSNVLTPPGRDYTVSSVKARCLPRDRLDEHFIIHMDGGNILAVTYGSPGACPYPRQLKLPSKWSFNSHTVLKNSEQAPRTPLFTEEIIGGVIGEAGEGEGVVLPERSFWAKYWMYLIPLVLIVSNAITQAMNMPEEQAAGQSAAPGPAAPAAIQRGGQQSAGAIRRR